MLRRRSALPSDDSPSTLSSVASEREPLHFVIGGFFTMMQITLLSVHSLMAKQGSDRLLTGDS